MVFFSPTRGRLTLEEVAREVLEYAAGDPAQAYTLMVGSDSLVRDATCFVTAIIIHRVGKGARYFYTRKRARRMPSLQQRILYEASLSLALANELVEELARQGRTDLAVEIHLDVGTAGGTREMVKEVIGMVVGSGFAARIKPDACGASKVADRHTRGAAGKRPAG